MVQISDDPDASGAGSGKLRVLFINDTSRTGGPGRGMYEILKFLDPAVVTRVVVVPREGVVSRRLRDAKVMEQLILEPLLVENIVEPFSRAMVRGDFHASLLLKGLRSVGNVARATRGILSLIRLAKSEKFDLVFCQGTTANFVGGAIAAFTNVPVIWRVLYTAIPAALRPLHIRLAALPNVRSIICISASTTRLFDHCQDKVRLIYNAVDIEEFDARATTARLRKEFGWDDDVVVFGSHGRVVPKKGYAEMVRAARLMLDQATQEERRRCKFVVFGDTPEDTRRDHLSECRALVERLKLGDAFHFMGHRPDVRPYLADYDVQVVPSVYPDPLPRAVMEAMALAKPVIAFAMGGIAETVENGETGALVQGAPPDLPGLASAMLRYMRDADLRRRHGEAGRRRIESQFQARVNVGLIQAEMLRVAQRPARA